MVGQTISHYHITELLGAGGMGVVYKAEDSRLRRAVALKFLPLELTRDLDAKERLMQEARAASALDHPNICTIHEIDETPEGQLFLAMAYYDGETLKQRLARGPLTIADAVDVAAQVARAIAVAHEAGIVHRDIKSANIMLTRRGEVKLVDFGLAKLAGQTGLTRTGTTVGTVAYMAPEQIAGIEADQRSDVWALGVVLYEMLSGSLPFTGGSDAAVLNAILNASPPPLRGARPEIPAELERVVARALQKDPSARFASARELLAQLPVAAPATTSVPMQPAPTVALRRALARPRVAVLSALAVAVVGTAAAWSISRAANARWARNTALPEIKRLVAQDNYVAAFALAKSAEPFVAGDAEFASLWPKLSVTRSITTNPSGAAVYVRDASLRSDWQLLGHTPLDHVRIPAAVCRWKFEKPGFDGRQFIATPIGPYAVLGAFDLTPAGSLPPDMIKVPAGPLQLTLTGFDYNKTIPSDEFLIDKFEVTNKAFKEFVDGGGYEKREYWKHEFVKDGHSLPWEQAMATFLDQTGRPGPSTWEVGTYPKAQESYPVGGVSWYEAAAYAEFREKSLPTIYHWLRAAGTPGAADITPLSNFGKQGTRPVGQSPAVTWVGVSDMAGNVKEWCWNEMEPGGNRYILGGAWDEPDYMFIYPDARSPFDRSATNGFRLVKYLKPESAPAATLALIEKPTRNYENEKPASDEVFRAYKSLYAYDPTPLDSKLERVEDSSDHWRKEKVSFSAAYGQERVPAFLFLPKKTKPPFQTVLYWPGSNAVRTRSSESLPDVAAIEFLLVSGRAVLYPVYYGTYERNPGRDSTWPEMTHAYHDWVLKQVNDARRSLDYLATRSDVRPEAIGYFGISWGARMIPVVLGQDSRVRAAVLASGGFSPGKAPPETDPFNFAPRVSVPVLMINGDRDYIFDVQISQNPLFQALGTPADRKRHLVLEASHAVFIEKRNQMIREALDWFDRYLGPVQ